MGCASSTPLVTSGSNMLKAASHVAADATKNAEDAVEDVTKTLGKTIDMAKESVGTAVTGIAHELSSAIKDKTDETKTSIMEKLHLNNNGESTGTTGQLSKQNEQENIAAGHDGNGANDDDDNDDDIDVENEGNDDITQRLSRGPTPMPVQQDSDSLKTTSSEPEIEQALANRNRNSPPTPKPSISELERLSAELHDLKKTDVIADVTHSVSPMVSHQSTSDVSAHMQAEEARIEHRPSTTEWEKYADLLAKDQKFHPNEIALRRRLIGSNLVAATVTTLGTAAGTAGLIGTTDTEAVAVAASLEAAVSMTTAPNPLIRNQSKASIHPPQYFRDFPRSTTDINRLQNDDESGYSDRNNGSTSSPLPTSRYSAKFQRKRMTRNSTTSNVKKMHRQLTTLVGYGSDRSALPIGCANRSSNILGGRNFDFNPNRMRVSSPIVRRRTNQILLPLRLNEPIRLANRLGSRIGSPVKIAPIKQQQQQQRSRLAFGRTSPTQILSSSSSPSRIGLHSFDRINSASTKAETVNSQSRSSRSRSSTNNSIQVAIKSNCTTPILCSPSKNSLSNITVGVVPINNVPPIITDNQCSHSQPSSVSPSPSPEPAFVDDFRFDTGRRKSLGLQRSPIITKNTSSFLSSPRSSPFSVRKSYNEFEDKENKAAFVTDLSSVTDNRHLLIPSPYKMRERCAVCYNKYIVK